MIDIDTEEDIRDIARFHVQHYLTINHSTVIDQLAHLAKMQGVTEVKGIKMPRSPEFRGVAIELTNGRQYILYNTAHPIETQQHYIAHELFHLIAEHPNGWSIEREQAADTYANCLLELLSNEDRCEPL